MRTTQIRPEFVGDIPERLEEGVLYISDHGTAMHLCCCGCGREVVTPLSPAEWRMTNNNGRVSLFPSVGNWSFPCRSHYWIRANQIFEAEQWSDAKIAAARRRDNVSKANYYQPPKPAPVVQSAPKPVSEGWLVRLLRKIFGM